MDAFTILDPVFQTYVVPNTTLEKLGEGFRWLEGPVWFADAGCLLVSDLPNDTILRWTENGGISVYRSPSGFENGHTRDREGRLIGCSHRNRCLTRTEIDGTLTTLVTHYQGKRLNSPNDVVAKKDGTLWFSDPTYGIMTDYEGGKQTPELPPSVYCFDPRSSILTLVANDFEGPNGLCFSPDEDLLYIVESGVPLAAKPTHHIRVFDVPTPPTLLGAGRLFHHIKPGHEDGIRADEHGNIWAAAGDGVHCINKDGKLLGKINVPFPVSNLTFGGPHKSRLFICASHTLLSIFVNVRGAQSP